MSARLLIDAICDLGLPPMRATDDEISALRANPDLFYWYEYADCMWSANAIAESLLVTRRNLREGGCLIVVGSSPPPPQSSDNRDWWTRLEDTVNQDFAYWAVLSLLAGIVLGVVV
jgi:hypothetical protein